MHRLQAQSTKKKHKSISTKKL